jgi:hypothetical protein
VIVAVVFAATGEVAAVKAPLTAPPRTVTLDGTAAAPLFEASATDTPPVGAARLSVTVPVAFAAPYRLAGASPTESSAGGGAVTRRFAVLLAPANVAVMLAVASVFTGVVVTVKLAVINPAATVTLAGTETAAMLEETGRETPPDPAAAVSVTVPVIAAPPWTLDGERLSVARDGSATGAAGSPPHPADAKTATSTRRLATHWTVPDTMDDTTGGILAGPAEFNDQPLGDVPRDFPRAGDGEARAKAATARGPGARMRNTGTGGEGIVGFHRPGRSKSTGGMNWGAGTGWPARLQRRFNRCAS